MWNLIIEGRVHEIFASEPVLHPRRHLVEGDAQLGDVWDGIKFSVFVASLPDEPTRIAQIKSAAGSVILKRYPQWKQSNMTARMLELVNKKLSAALTASEIADEVAITAAWSWVKSVRTQSDIAEATPGLLASQVIWPPLL